MSWLWRQSRVTTRAGTHHWQGKTVSPFDVKTPRYGGVKIYSRLGQDTSIRYELALIPGPGHITGRGRLQVRATLRPRDVVLGNFKIYLRLGLGISICFRDELAQDRDATNHWRGKTVSPCDVKTPRYGGAKIYSRLGQDTSIRYELALTLGPGHITGRGRP